MILLYHPCVYTHRNKRQHTIQTPAYMFIAVLFTIAKLWNQSKYPQTDEWIKKMWCIYTMEYYSAIKKNKMMLLSGKWMELEIIMLSKISQTQKDKYHIFFHMHNLDLKIQKKKHKQKRGTIGGGIGGRRERDNRG
jgi:hypothetical protein